MMHPILYVDLFKQSSYKNSVSVSMMHKQLTYFSKKYSKMNRITLNKINRLSKVCEKDNIKVVKYVNKKINIIKCNNFVLSNGKYGCVRVVRYILNNGFDVNCQKIKFNYSDYVLLTYCSQNGNIEVVKLLLKKGANIHADNDIALLYGAYYGHIEIIKLLLEKGAYIHAYDDYVLRWSAKYGHIEIVKLLLDKGVNIHAKNDEALRLSADNGHIEIVKLLLEKGAYIHAVNDIALRWSAYNKHIEIVKLLLEKGANIHAINDEALRVSAYNGNIDVVKLLLEYDANIHALNLNNIHSNVKQIVEEKLKLEQ